MSVFDVLSQQVKNKLSSAASRLFDVTPAGQFYNNIQTSVPKIQSGIQSFAVQHPTVTNIAMKAEPVYNFGQNVMKNIPANPIQVPKFQFKNPVGNFVANLPGSFAEGLLNAPAGLIKGAYQFPQSKTKAEAAGNTAQILNSVMMMGIPKNIPGILKEATNQPIPLSTGQKLFDAMKSGARSGAGFGGVSGALTGMEQAKNVTDPIEYLKQVGIQTAGGLVMGGALGGVLGGVGEGFKLTKQSIQSGAKNYADMFAQQVLDTAPGKRPIWARKLKTYGEIHEYLKRNYTQQGAIDFNAQVGVSNGKKPSTGGIEDIVSGKKPIYHGTDKVFDKFDPNASREGGAWFTDRKASLTDKSITTSGKGVVMERYMKPNLKLLDANNPTDKKLIDNLMPEQLIRDGYAGVISEGDNVGERFIHLFDPNKSTTIKPMLPSTGGEIKLIRFKSGGTLEYQTKGNTVLIHGLDDGTVAGNRGTGEPTQAVRNLIETARKEGKTVIATGVSPDSSSAQYWDHFGFVKSDTGTFRMELKPESKYYPSKTSPSSGGEIGGMGGSVIDKFAKVYKDAKPTFPYRTTFKTGSTKDLMLERRELYDNIVNNSSSPEVLLDTAQRIKSVESLLRDRSIQLNDYIGQLKFGEAKAKLPIVPEVPPRSNLPIKTTTTINPALEDMFSSGGEIGGVDNAYSRYAKSKGISIEEAKNRLKSPLISGTKLVEKSIPEDYSNITVYHGTNAKFDTFKSGITEGSKGTYLQGHYFTDNPKTAGMFGENIKQANITAKNPLVIDYQKSGMNYLDIQKELDAISKGISPSDNLLSAIEKGSPNKWDVAILKNVDYEGKVPFTEYIVKNPKNISNVSNFNPSSGEIPKGIPEGKAMFRQPIKTQASVNQEASQVPLQTPQTQPKQSSTALSPQGQPVKPSAGSSLLDYNTSNLNVSKKAKTFVSKTIEEVKPSIEKAVGKTLTNKEALDVANNTSKVLDKVVTRQETLAWEAKMLKARELLAKQAQEGTVTQEYIDNLLAVKTQGTDIARKLQSLGMGADPKEVTAKQAILEAVLKVTGDADVVLAKAKGVDFNNYEQAASFYRQFVKPTAGDWLEKVRYSSMLSSPNTHINNASSNFQGTGIIAPIEKTISGGIDALASVLNPKRARKQFAGEGVAYAKGYYSKLGEAYKKFANTMSGKDISSAQEMYNLPLTSKGTVARKVENVLSVPGKLLQAADEFFQTLTQGGSTAALKLRESKGVKVQDIQGQAYLEGRKRLFNSAFGLKDEGYVLKALEYIPSKVAEARASSNPVISIIAKFSFPFVRVPSNILKASVEYGPMGLATIPGAKNKVEQLSKAILGTSIGIATATLVASDRMTWAEPTDPKKKAQFRAANMQPYAIKIGNEWYSYSKLHPAIAFNMALVAALRDSQKNKLLDDGQVDTVLNGLAKWVNFYADMSYVKNIGDAVSGVKGDLTAGTRQIGNYVQQVVPFRALMGWVARIVDSYQRQVDADGSILEKQLQSLMTQIPGLSGQVPTRNAPDGTPIENPHRFINAVSPVRVTTEDSAKRAIYESSVTKSINTRQENVIKQKVLDTGVEQTYNGKRYYKSSELDTKTGERVPVVKSIKVPQSQSDVYKNLPKEYETEYDSPKNLIEKIGVYGTGIFKDPDGTINAIMSGQPIRKVNGDAVVVERLKNLSALDQGDKATQVDHIIPISLGGTNDEKNLAIISTQDNQAKGIVDTYLSSELKAGRITQAEAQKRDLNWRQELNTLPPTERAKAMRIMESPAPISSAKSTKIGNLSVSTREEDKFPFPDYSQSAPGQTLRADLNFNGNGNADIVLHFKSPNGQTIDVPQTQEAFNGGKNSYGLEMKIPSNIPSGKGEIWVTVNGQEIAGTRKAHEIISGKNTNRYGSTMIANDPTMRIENVNNSKSVLTSLQSRQFEPIYNGDTYSDVQIKIPEVPQYTGMADLDKQLKSKYTSALSTAKTNIGKLYLDGQLTAQEANDAIQSLTASGSSGGKKVAGLKPTFKKYTIKKVKAIKLAKIKKIKVPKLAKIKPLKKNKVKKLKSKMISIKPLLKAS